MSSTPASYGSVHKLKAEIDRLIELLVESSTSSSTTWQPPVDLVELEDTFEIQAEVPGVHAQQLHVELRDQTLHVRGAKSRLDAEPPGRRFHLMERFMGSFSLQIDLPRPIRPAECTCRLEDGVLVAVLPKLVDRRHRTHSIEVVDTAAHDE